MKAWIISDTHGLHRSLQVPDGIDIVFCAGDMGTVRDPGLNANVVWDFLDWYASLPIKHKVVIDGNHDTSVAAGLVKRENVDKSITYLFHESVTIEGIKIFGSPFTPSFSTGWAFNIPREHLDAYWKEIPSDTDILITHGPAKGILDMTQYDTRAGADGKGFFQCGCKSLLNRINEVKPQFHIFGHIHPESNCLNSAILKVNGMKTTFINAAVVNLRLNLVNNGFIIDI